MMKLLLAVIATCALVVSPTCIKIKHQLRSNAPTIDVVISNGNTQMTSQVSRDGSHRFITDNLSNMTLAPAGSQTITLSYDQIFPLTNAAVCTEVHPLSAGGCADGVCCKISISMYTITDAIIMTARVNNRKADGNPQFWKCEQEIQVPGVTNTELSPEELVTDILHGETPGDDCTIDTTDVFNECGDPAQTHLVCKADTLECECDSGYVANAVGDACRVVQPGDDCVYQNDCEGDDLHLTCSNSNECECISGYVADGDACREVKPGDGCPNGDCGNSDDTYLTCSDSEADADDLSKCECVSGFVQVDVECRKVCDDTVECHSNAECEPEPQPCQGGSCQSRCTCATGYYYDGVNVCTDIDECDPDYPQHNCHTHATCTNALWTTDTVPAGYTCACNSGYYGDGLTCTPKRWGGQSCTPGFNQCLSNDCSLNCKNGVCQCTCEYDTDCYGTKTCTTSTQKCN